MSSKWSRLVILLLASYLLFVGINFYFYPQIKVRELNKAIEDLHGDRANDFIVPTLLRPLRLQPTSLLLSARVIGHDPLVYLHYRVELPPESGFQLLYEIGQGSYHALEAARKNDRLVVRTILYRDLQEAKVQILRDVPVEAKRLDVKLAVTRKHERWFLSLNDEALTDYEAPLNFGMDCGAAVLKGAPLLTEIAGLLGFANSPSPQMTRFRYAFGERLMVWPELLRFATGTGLAFLVVHLMWVLILTSATRIALTSLLWLGWINFTPLIAILLVRSHPTKVYYALGIGSMLLMKVWLAYLLGSRYPLQAPLLPRKPFKCLALSSVLASIIICVTADSLDTYVRDNQASRDHNKVVDYGNNLILTDTFEYGRLELQLVFHGPAAIQVFLPNLHESDISNVRTGVILSSDPRFPCRFAVSRWDTIDHWAFKPQLVLPSETAVIVALERRGDNLLVYYNGELADTARGMIAEHGVVETFSVKGKVTVTSAMIEHWHRDRGWTPSFHSLATAAFLPLLALLAALALSCSGTLGFRRLALVSLTAIQPAHWLIAVYFLWDEPLRLHLINRLPGTVVVFSQLVIVLMLIFFVAAHNSKFKVPALLTILLLIPLTGFGEDLLRQWTPDRTMYMEDSYNFTAKPPLPEGYEWYLIQRMRYTNTYHRTGRVEREPIAIAAPDEVTRIVTLGGSTVVCSDRQYAERKDYSKLLEAGLHQLTQGRFEVVNGGVKGYTTLLSWYWFDNVLRSLAPKVVIVSSVYNNQLSFSLESQEAQFQKLQAMGEGLIPMVRFYVHDLRVTKLLRTTAINYLRASGRVVVSCVAPEDYGKSLDRFVTAAQNDNFQLILVKEPTVALYETSEPKSLLATTMDRYYQVLDAKRLEHSLPVVDVRETFRGYDRNLIFTDEVHLTDFGNELVGQALTEQVITLLQAR